MEGYKNERRTVALRHAFRFWKNLTKNYQGTVEETDFFFPICAYMSRDDIAILILETFPEKELKPLMEAKSSPLELDTDGAYFMLNTVWNESNLRQRCKTMLLNACDKIVKTKIQKDTDADRVFARRFKRLCEFLNLSELEREILLLVYLRSQTMLCEFPNDSERDTQIADFYAMAVDRPYPDVVCALSKQGKLRRYNCILDNYFFNNGDFGGYFSGFDSSPLADRYYRRYTGETLPWNFFGALADRDGTLLCEMLNARQKGNCKLNILLYGVPGTGKTSFAHALVEKVRRQSFDLLLGEGDGTNFSAATRLAGIQIFNEHNCGTDAVLIIDEADELLRTKATLTYMRGSEKGVINSILDSMKLPAIWISNTDPGEMDPSVRRRFDYSICFRALSGEQRCHIWENNIEKFKMTGMISDSTLKQLAMRYDTSAGGISLVLENVNRLQPSPKRVGTLIETFMKSHCELMGRSVQNGSLSPSSDYSLDGLSIKGDVGLDRILGAIRRFQSENDNPLLSQSTDRPRMNILLWGPPGTGKTEYVKYLGAMLQTQVVVKMGSDLLDQYVGGTEDRIRDAFADAKASKAILFLDELDGMVQNRGNARHSWEVSQVNELLYQMENFSGVMIGATNFFTSLDPAILRRFTFKLEFSYLDSQGKRIFFERFFQTPLTAEEQARLDAIPDISPGDFRTVRQSLYYLGEDVTNAIRLSELEKESRTRRSSHTTAAVGFRVA
ncbi:MAG: ATP-binding protein [Kiritimatiellae bacterium]|nr:ATP-binding protein [Kiritimatiellia bacterium]